MSHLGKNISTIRVLSGMTQTEFAKYIIGKDGNKGMISSYENNIAKPSLVALNRIARLGSVAIDDLLNKELKEESIRIEKNEKNDINIAVFDLERLQSEIIALKASIKILALKVVELETQEPDKKPKRSFSKASLELGEMMQQERKRMLDELRMS